MITLKAPAKINLTLCIGELRPDGKHEVMTVMNEVSGLFDEVGVELTAIPKISITCSDSHVPCDESNLVYKAAKAYFERFGIQNGANIHIEKHTPMTGGLGGGSSDAASVLLALQKLCGHGNTDDLSSIAAKLGSDVPFFIYRKRTMLCLGTGELAASCPSLPRGLYGVFVTHGEKESTGQAYAILDEKLPPKARLSRNTGYKERMLSALNSASINEIFSAMTNDFEITASHFSDVAAELYANGAEKVILCGSGPTVCGIFTSIDTAEACSRKLCFSNFISSI